MFGIKMFDPWIGKSYPQSHSKILILGESRYDEVYTDRKIIKEMIGGGRNRTYTNFVQAVVAKRYWEKGYDAPAFWNRVIFYNYNTTFYPGEPRVAPEWKERMDTQNQRMLRKMLERYKPTHCIVWGIGNWDSIVVDGIDWEPERPIPGLSDSHVYCSIVVDGNKTLFSFVRHPSAGFSYDRWSAAISAFLALKS